MPFYARGASINASPLQPSPKYMSVAVDNPVCPISGEGRFIVDTTCERCLTAMTVAGMPDEVHLQVSAPLKTARRGAVEHPEARGLIAAN